MSYIPGRCSSLRHALRLLAALGATGMLLPTLCHAQERKAELERRLASPDGAVMVVAHRGCWQGTSENSLDAIETCIAAGVDMVELDVRATRDGKLVLMHDATVDRMTNGSGRVEDMDWAQLRKLRLREGGGRGTPVTKRRIPTFEDALRAARNRILINVDAKSSLSASVLTLVDGASTRAQILFKAEAPAARILAESAWASTVRFQPILRQPYMTDPANLVATYDALKPVSYEIDVKDHAFTAAIAPLFHERCARYWVNSLSGRVFDDRDALKDPDAVWGRLVAMGVDAIQTDEPLALRAWLRRTGAKARACEAPVAR